MSKVVVTGGCGFIGSHLANTLSQQHEVIVIDNLLTGHKENLNTSANIKLITSDICDAALLKPHLVDVESVYHLAARISVTESMEKPNLYVETNCMGTLNLLEACKQANVKNFIFSSTAAVYGNNPVLPKTEDLSPEPQSPYAMTKLDSEFYCKLYHEQYDLNTSILRYFNVYGPKQDPRSAYASVIPIFIDKAIHHQDIIIYGDGKQTRDFVFVDDIVQANLAAAGASHNIFNVCSGQSISINELAEMIIKITNSKSKIIYKDARGGDIKDSLGDNTKLQHHLGYHPKHSLIDGLTATVKYFYDTHKSIA